MKISFFLGAIEAFGTYRFEDLQTEGIHRSGRANSYNLKLPVDCFKATKR